MIRFVLCSTIIIGILVTSILASNMILTKSSFASTLASMKTLNKSIGDPEYREINSILELRLNKNNFRPGETVTIVVKNNGFETLTFPDAALGLVIENVRTKEIFSLMAAQVLTSLQPGEIKRIELDQSSLVGLQVNNGKYKVSVKTIPDQNLRSLSAYSYFQVQEN
jgi:archaellum component FlaG (FlaF/FlaG flagellin family)